MKLDFPTARDKRTLFDPYKPGRLAGGRREEGGRDEHITVALVCRARKIYAWKGLAYETEAV